MATAWAAEAVKQVGTIVEPAWTWNVIVTVAVGMMVWSLRRKITEADKLKEKLITNAIESLEKSIMDWQTGARERTASLCKKIDDIANDVKNRVPFEHCNDKHRIMREELHDIKTKLYP